MRIALLFASIAFAACTVGEVDTSNNMGTDPDACVDRLATPDLPHMHLVGGTSNKGQNCIVAGCHLNNSLGAGAPGYQFAGTVYAVGTTNPSPGAVIRITAGTTVLQTYADGDGNFHFDAGRLSGTFTATTSATACPTVMKMVTTLSGGGTGGGGGGGGGGDGGAGANSCNLCHQATGGTTTPIAL